MSSSGIFGHGNIFSLSGEDSTALLLEHFGLDEEEFGALEDEGEGTLFGDTDLLSEEEEVGLPGGGTLFSSFSEAEAGSPEPEAPAPVARGRLAMAQRVRAGVGSDRYGAGYLRGVQDALAHVGVSDPELTSRLSLLWDEAVSTTPAVSSPSGLPDAFGALSRASGGKSMSRLLDGGAAIEADHHELPPVYVVDTDGVRERVLAGQHLGSVGDFAVQDRFGDAALSGFVGTQSRAGARRAAERAIASASERTSATRPGQGAAFVEDVNAEPRLFSDGSILESVYGKLRTVPCPSCSTCSGTDVRSGHAEGCGVCDAYGAVLVPEAEAHSWLGIRYGSLVPLLLGVGLDAAGLLLGVNEAKAKVAPKKVKKKTNVPKFTWTEGEEEVASDDSTADPEVARAVVPERWFSGLSNRA